MYGKVRHSTAQCTHQFLRTIRPVRPAYSLNRGDENSVTHTNLTSQNFLTCWALLWLLSLQLPLCFRVGPHVHHGTIGVCTAKYGKVRQSARRLALLFADLHCTLPPDHCSIAARRQHDLFYICCIVITSTRAQRRRTKQPYPRTCDSSKCKPAPSSWQ